MDKPEHRTFANGLQCPVPLNDTPQVLLAHGGGGRLMHQLIDTMFAAAFGTQAMEHDGAVLAVNEGELAFTTDSYVVHPLFFPGGDIGRLAVWGTVNDLAMCGAVPQSLSAGFILEEGLSMETLWRVVQSMQRAAEVAGVRIVTGDTKVVERGKGDGMFINTAGVGRVIAPQPVSPSRVRPGDAILLNGDIGRHGMALAQVREGLRFESAIESDCAPLHGVVRDLIESGIDVHCLRDLTRGGLATALVEIAKASSLSIALEETKIGLGDAVRGACELLGFDPLYVANEGRCVAFVPEEQAETALHIMRRHEQGRHAARIGTVEKDDRGRVTLQSAFGTMRLLDLLSGDQLPRIC
ncbi:hydrogenase expression/formation protein HypE [Nitrospina gracilis]|uniref:hydrogenase expression/formation protein HypE n=1 Tax=Nitrospina gracilis TaxID=35801 RepID=UPI001F1AAA99|nr:hydrogenase expression/formation protein HypE [Nitrospina gracilis Nb-211]